LLGDTEVLVAEESIRREATGLALALSMVGLFVKPPASDIATLLSKHSRIVMLSQIDNPTNVGAIMRSAQAFGFHGVVLDSETSDPFTRRALRVSMGTSFDANICRVTQLAPVLEEFHANGFTSCALTPARDAHNIADIDPIEKLILILGSEREGLEASVMNAATMRVKLLDDSRISLARVKLTAVGIDSSKDPTANFTLQNGLVGDRVSSPSYSETFQQGMFTPASNVSGTKWAVSLEIQDGSNPSVFIDGGFIVFP
jgi:tRNA(Leu) C34 or U34 (ribose-2'-O)-methylase TrmL